MNYIKGILNRLTAIFVAEFVFLQPTLNLSISI